MMFVHAITNRFHSAEMIERSSTGKAVSVESDFRLLRDEINGEQVRKYVEFMEKINEHHTESLNPTSPPMDTQ